MVTKSGTRSIQTFLYTTDRMGSPEAAVTVDPATGGLTVVERYVHDPQGKTFVAPGECRRTDIDCDGVVGASDLVLVRNSYTTDAPDGAAEDICSATDDEPDNVIDEYDLYCVREDLGLGIPGLYTDDDSSAAKSSASSDGPDPTQRLGLHGLPVDEATGLVYARARYYHPKLGRWMKRDPKGYVDGGNLYEAFGSNQARFSDPMGTSTAIVPEEFNDGDEAYYQHSVFLLGKDREFLVGTYRKLGDEELIVYDKDGAGGFYYVLTRKQVKAWSKQVARRSEYNLFVERQGLKIDELTGEIVERSLGEDFALFFAENMETERERLHTLVASYSPEVFVAGPAWMAFSGDDLASGRTVPGRFRVAAGVLAAAEVGGPAAYTAFPAQTTALANRFLRPLDKFFLGGSGLALRSEHALAGLRTSKIMKKRPPGRRLLNLGSGRNPMPNAVNVDRLAVKGVDVVADANALPFRAGIFDEVVAINPAGAVDEFFNPLAGDVARVLAPRGTVTVVAQPSNFAFRQLKRMDSASLRLFGFDRVGAPAAAERRFLFGQASTVSGRPLFMENARQLSFRLRP